VTGIGGAAFLRGTSRDRVSLLGVVWVGCVTKGGRCVPAGCGLVEGGGGVRLGTSSGRIAVPAITAGWRGVGGMAVRTCGRGLRATGPAGGAARGSALKGGGSGGGRRARAAKKAGKPAVKPPPRPLPNPPPP